MNYPILKSGAVAQYPLSRRTRHHILQTETPGGQVKRIHGGRTAEVGWTIQYEDLTDAEAGALELLFEASGGGLQTFRFVDPLANLLRSSGDLNAEVWSRAGVTAAAVEGEPGTFVVTNGAQAEAMVWQSVGAVPGMTVCFSCEVGGLPGAEVKLRCAGQESLVRLTPQWQRVWVAGVAAGEDVVCGVAVPAAASVVVRRLQAENQMAPTEYKSGDPDGGVHQVRFEAGGLETEITGKDRNAMVVRLRGRRGSLA